MKKYSLLLIVFVLLAFQTDGSPVSIKVVKVVPIDSDGCKVAVELHNASAQKINYLSMYCSYDGFYVTDNPGVLIVPRPCDKNFPITKTLSRATYHTANLELKMAEGIKDTKFRIGFKLIEVPKGVDLRDFDSTKVGSVTIWSNTIQYKGRR